MTAKTNKDVIVVPVAAVFKNPEGGGDYVLLAGTDNKAHLKAVQSAFATPSPPKLPVASRKAIRLLPPAATEFPTERKSR